MTRASWISHVSHVGVIALSLLASIPAPAQPAESAFPDGVGPPLRRYAFFPPSPPPLGSPVQNRPSTVRIDGRDLAAPDELASEVGENFYPPLGTRLWEEGKLSAALTKRLQAYQAERTTLVHELLEALTMARLLDAPAREAELRRFAREQTPRVAAWEKEGEDLRVHLIRGGALETSADWNQNRKWRIGAMKVHHPKMEAVAMHQVIRAAAFYQNGLGVEQRWLLRELVLDVEARMRADDTGRRLPTDVLLSMFFSPGTARMRLPSNLPAELTSKIGRYNGEREGLKSELREAVFSADRLSERKRVTALTELTEKQWPRLAALEAVADEIRRELAALPPPPPPKLPPPLPKELEGRIKAYKEDRAALDAELRERIRASRTPPTLPPEQISAQGRTELLRAHATALAEAQRAAVKIFRTENAERYADLASRAVTLRQELEEFGKAMVDSATGRSMDAATVMRYYNTAMLEFEAVGRREVIYNDYETAMLEPGLSVEQRRLLFSAALARLSQPLPPGRRMPNGEPVPMPF